MKAMTELAEALQIYLRRSLPDVGVSRFQRIGHGWENEVYLFSLEKPPTGSDLPDILSAHEICESARAATDKQPPINGDGLTKPECDQYKAVLRLYPGEDAAIKSAHEFHIMQTLHRLDFSVPRIYRYESDGSILGYPFVIMEYIPGGTLEQTLETAPPQSEVLMERFCHCLLKLHQLDWRCFVSDPDTDPLQATCDELEQWYVQIHDFGGRQFARAFEWVRSRVNALDREQLALIHCDYHPENVLLDDQNRLFVIDWGSSRVFDRRLDLGLSIVLRCTNPGFKDLLLCNYERLAGTQLQQIEVFEATAALIRLTNISISLRYGAEHRGMRPGAEEQMRQNREHICQVYRIFLERAGIEVPEFEQLTMEVSCPSRPN